MTANGFTLLMSKERDKLYGISSKDNKNKKGEKPAAWSEEDDKMVKDIIAAIDTLHYYEMVDWLKSLKQRIGG